jgi:hypothetical protein
MSELSVGRQRAMSELSELSVLFLEVFRKSRACDCLPVVRIGVCVCVCVFV